MPVQYIRASHILQYTKSPFLLWADLFANTEDQDPLSLFQEKLFERGDEHEQEVVDDLYPDADTVEYADAQDGFREVLKLFEQGVESITQAPLFWDEQLLRGRPDVLEKVEGTSKFGDYMYVVKEIKYAKNIKKKHVLQAAFYNKLLGHIQEYTPSYFVLINNEHKEFRYEYADYEQELEETLTQVREIVAGKLQPLPSYGEDWPWTSLSEKLATDNNDVTLLYKLGSSVRKRLHEIGIFTIDDFLNADKEEVLALKGIGTGSYTRWIKQAQAFKEDALILIKEPSFPESSKELYFDIEGDTELQIDYLYGILDGDNFIDFWADSPGDEEAMWKRFLSYIDSLPQDAVLYHYAPYEKQSIRKLRKKYGCDEQLYQKLHGMLVDLFPLVTKSVAAPLTSYSIKPLAKYLGFSWRASDAGGANSMEWYRGFLEGQTEYKEKILHYNHDDVLATREVKKWLESLKN